MANTTTRSQAEADNIRVLLKARNCLLWITTSEETRVEVYLAEAAAAAKFNTRFWDVAGGVTDIAGNRILIDDPAADQSLGDPREANGKDPSSVLNHINKVSKRAGEEPCVWVLRDMPAWLAGAPMAKTLREARNLARDLPSALSPQAIVILTPSAEVPPELLGTAVVVRWPMPDREELAGMLDRMAGKYGLDLNGTRDAAIDAAVGLSGEEAESCFARSLVSLRKIDPARIAAEKKSVISKAGLLTWLEPLAGGFDAVGGLDVIKAWTLKRRLAYTPAARAYRLTTPRGIFIGGISGCGKSYITGAIATELGNVPLIGLDIGALKSKYVGESEANFRKALDIINTIGRCVVRIDEIEKALAGATQGAADGGVSADALGTLLTWMNDRTNEAFIVATANDVTALPPEMLRKGRWDELFWVDLPTRQERLEILQAALSKVGRDNVLKLAPLNEIADATDTFTGAEIAALVPDAMFTAFADGEREVCVADLVASARDVTPLAKTAEKKITAMREWAKGKARPATTPEVATQVRAIAGGRSLDF